MLGLKYHITAFAKYHVLIAHTGGVCPPHRYVDQEMKIANND